MKQLLSLVSKPVRYLGREVNSVRKDFDRGRLRFCLAFPDVYEVGMSHLGIQILYHILNRREDVSCERVFAPWVDMEQVLREKKVPLCSLESSLPLSEFDIVGFSLQYELSFTNVLNMLDLSGIPFLSQERDDRFPLILGGGPAAFNPEPVAAFFDAIVIGDGEEIIDEICDVAHQWKRAKAGKGDLLKSLAAREGIYVPSFHPEGKRIRKRTLSDLDHAPFPIDPIVPYMRVIHDRLNLEIARGCKRGCRFCEAGFVHRPYRERSPEALWEIVHPSLRQTGYEEISLLSLSAGDYSCISPLLSSLMNRFERSKVAVSFPSLRIESVVRDLAEEVKRVRKTGFTIAPEAGTERLRGVINKEVDEEVLFRGLSDLFSKGWRNIKLYFMMGLPTERDGDLRGIIDLSKKIYFHGERQRVHPAVNVSVSTFVPKPHTPFQWESQISLPEIKERLSFLREEAKRNRLHLKWQDPHLSFLEGVFSRGGRDLSRVLIEAHRLGCRFDGWSDQFRYPLWREAFERAGLVMDSYLRKRRPDEILPWSFIDTGIDPNFLWKEYEKGLKGETSPPCSGDDCRRCGICDGKSLRVKGSDPKGIETLGRKEKGRIWKKAQKQKVRMGFTKRGDLRHLSHLEVAHLFYRASKRAGLPLRYSEGFHPMPRIVFARALPVGVESVRETVDVELEGGIPPAEMQARLNQALPQGIEIVDAREVLPSSSAPFAPDRSVYWILFDHALSEEEARARANRAMQQKELLIDQERKGKKRKTDVRALIERMDVKPFALEKGGSRDTEKGEVSLRREETRKEGVGDWGVELVLRGVAGRSAKPSEVIEAVLDLKGEPLSQCRIIKIE